MKLFTKDFNNNFNISNHGSESLSLREYWFKGPKREMPYMYEIFS